MAKSIVKRSPEKTSSAARQKGKEHALFIQPENFNEKLKEHVVQYCPERKDYDVKNLL